MHHCQSKSRSVLIMTTCYATLFYTLWYSKLSLHLHFQHIAELIFSAFSDNLSAENSKLSADSGIQRIQLLECMTRRTQSTRILAAVGRQHFQYYEICSSSFWQRNQISTVPFLKEFTALQFDFMFQMAMTPGCRKRLKFQYFSNINTSRAAGPANFFLSQYQGYTSRNLITPLFSSKNPFSNKKFPKG